MAKTYVNAVKYIIHVDFEVKGVVDKPDVIGAIFGQSEGLLGDELDLRELQKNGRLGRIEIKPKSAMGKTKGEILIPSSMDMVETSILGAAIETVDKVGPCEARFKIREIEDTRALKRQEITKRAQALLKHMLETQIPDAQELAEQVREQVRAADICKYGKEQLDAGPAIDESDSIIVVEGRADVLNLLRNGIKNVIAMGGSKIPQTLIDLSKKKSVTLFVDGDRGGELNIRKMKQLGKVDFIARAPDGKEVEELTRKELVSALRHKVSADEPSQIKTSTKTKAVPKKTVLAQSQPSLKDTVISSFSSPSLDAVQSMELLGKPISHEPVKSFRKSNTLNRGKRTSFKSRRRQGMSNAFRQKARSSVGSILKSVEENVSQEDRVKFQPVIDGLKGSLQAKLLNEKLEELETVPVRKMLESLKPDKGIHALVFDGIITKRVLDEAKNAKISVVVGVKKGKITEDKDIKTIAL